MDVTVIPPDPAAAPAAPVDQAPAQPPAPAAPVVVDQTAAAAIAQQILQMLQPAAAPQASPAPAASSAPADAAPPAAAPDYRPGSLAVYTHEHYGRTLHQLLLVVGVYTQDVPQRDGTVLTQHRVRALPLGHAEKTADMPADYEGLAPASAFDWEKAAG